MLQILRNRQLGYKNFIKSTAQIYFIEGIIAILGILLTKTAINYLGVEGFGQMVLMYNAATMCSIILAFGLKATLGVESLNKPSLTKIYPYFILYSAVLTLPITLTLFKYFFLFKGLEVLFIFVAAIGIATGGITVSKYQFLGDIKKLIKNHIIFFLFPLVLTIVLYQNRIGTYWLRVLVYFPLIIYFLYLLKAGFRESNKLNHFKILLNSNLMMLVYSLAQWILANGDAYLINKFHESTDVGMYLIHYKVASIISLITLPLLAVWNGYYTKYKRHSVNKNSYEKLSILVIISIVLVAGFVYICFDYIYKYFDKFTVVEDMLKFWLVSGLTIYVLNTMLVPLLIWRKMFKEMMFGALLSAALNLVLNTFMLPQNSIGVSGFITFLTYFTLTTLWLLMLFLRQKNI